MTATAMAPENKCGVPVRAQPMIGIGYARESGPACEPEYEDRVGRYPTQSWTRASTSEDQSVASINSGAHAPERNHQAHDRKRSSLSP